MHTGQNFPCQQIHGGVEPDWSRTDAESGAADWSVPVGVSAFREGLTPGARAAEGCGGAAREDTSPVLPRGTADQSQGAGMPYMLISTQIRLVCIPHDSQERRVEIHGFIDSFDRATLDVFVINQPKLP